MSQVVSDYFSSLPDWREGDLISATDVEAVIRRVDDAGWTLPADQSLADRALTESSFLIRQKSSRSGRRFLRKVGRNKGAYSRLDRLSTTADGRKHIRYLIRQKDGHLLIEYLTTTKGGLKLGRQLASVRRGVDLNKPTGRIYTAAELLAELERIHTAEVARIEQLEESSGP